MSTTVLSGGAIEAENLADWRFMFITIEAHFAFDDYATGLEFVARVGAAAQAADHHPDVDLRYGFAHLRLFSHDVGGVTQRDVRLARSISAIAADLGLTASPQKIQVVEFALDTWDSDQIRPFWAALLALPDRAQFEIVDPAGRETTLWFQRSPEHDLPLQRFHYDVRVPPECVSDRIAAALSAGGTLIDDSHAPAFWVLADPQGNKACVTTWQGRD